MRSAGYLAFYISPHADRTQQAVGMRVMLVGQALEDSIGYPRFISILERLGCKGWTYSLKSGWCEILCDDRFSGGHDLAGTRNSKGVLDMIEGRAFI